MYWIRLFLIIVCGLSSEKRQFVEIRGLMITKQESLWAFQPVVRDVITLPSHAWLLGTHQNSYLTQQRNRLFPSSICLCFKTNPRAKPFIWKSGFLTSSFRCNSYSFSFERSCTWTRFQTEAEGNSETAYGVPKRRNMRHTLVTEDNILSTIKSPKSDLRAPLQPSLPRSLHTCFIPTCVVLLLLLLLLLFFCFVFVFSPPSIGEIYLGVFHSKF